MAWVRTALVFIVTAMALSASAQAPQRRVALIVANSVYQHAPHLPNARLDASLVEPAFRRAGFTEVAVVRDAGIGAMQAALADFTRKARGAQVAALYYAGHSLEGAGGNWLIPADAKVRDETDLEFEAINLRLVLNAVSGATMRLVLLDACRDNPLGDAMTRSLGATRSGAPSGALTQVSADGVLILYATEPGRTATDGVSGQNSPFARAVARWLPDPNTPVQNFGFRVRDDVRAATQGSRRPQTPFVSASITGEPFFLVTGPAPPPVAVADPAPRKQLEDAQRRIA